MSALQQYVATFKQLFEMCDIVEEHETSLAIFLEEMSGIGRSMLALNPMTFYEFQRRNLATHDVIDPPAGHFEQVLVSMPPGCLQEFSGFKDLDESAGCIHRTALIYAMQLQDVFLLL